MNDPRTPYQQTWKAFEARFAQLSDFRDDLDPEKPKAVCQNITVSGESMLDLPWSREIEHS
jgi:hypothetical protein